MTQKNMMYDHPAYTARQVLTYPQNAAGASTNFGKFVAWTNTQIFAVTAAAVVAATSTYTSVNGTGTVVSINGDSFNLIHVLNGTAVTTATHGPFSISTGTATTTSSIGSWTRVQLSATGTTGNVQATLSTADGGVNVNPGDTLHILRGTDATAVSVFGLEYAVQQFAPVSN